MRVRVVVLQREVLEAEGEEVHHAGVQLHPGQRAALAGELQLGLLQVVRVQVHIAEGVHELAGFQAADLRHHQGQQRVARDVEGHAQEGVRTALVQLAAQLAIGHVELEQRVAGRQGHAVHIGGVPGGDDHAAAVRTFPDHLHHVRDLVDHPAIGRVPAAPLVAVHGAQIAVFIGPLVPDPHTVVLQVLHVGVAGQEPQQLMHDALQVQLLGGHHRETFRQVEAHLVAETADGAGAGAVGLLHPFIKDAAEEVVVLAHGCAKVPQPPVLGPQDLLTAVDSAPLFPLTQPPRARSAAHQGR